MRRQRLSRLAAPACGLLLAACAVDQDGEVALYRQVLDAAVARTGDYRDGEALTLPRALALANQNNEHLAVRGEDYVQALINQSRLADSFLPTVSFTPFYAVEDLPTGKLAGTAPGYRRVGGTAQRFEAPVVGDVNVFRGFGDVASLHAAEAIVGQRRELLLDLQASILVDVAQVYYRVLRAERAVTVLRTSLDFQQARLTDAEQRLRNGLATRLEVAQTRAQVDGTRASLVQQEGEVKDARIALAVLIGVPAVSGELTGGFTATGERAEAAACAEQAVAHRQDLQAAHDAVVAAQHQVDAAVAQYYPSVSLDVAGFLYREDFKDASRWSAILSLNLPLFSAGRIRADVRDAWSRFRQAALLESAMRRQVLADVSAAHNQLATSDRRLREVADEVAAADEALQQARSAFSNHLATNLDVLTAQDHLLAAQLDLTDVEFDQTVFYLVLVRAMGRMHEVAAAG